MLGLHGNSVFVVVLNSIRNEFGDSINNKVVHKDEEITPSTKAA
jgi:hypothetical protein